MNAAETLLLLMAIWISLYLCVGVLYGAKHMRFIRRRVIEVGERARILHEKVSIYDMTPAGAAYYTELQELHITEAEMLSEHAQYVKNPKKYQFNLFLFGSLFWIYYLVTLLVMKAQKPVIQ